MFFSQRSQNLPASPIRRLEPYLQEALKNGKKVYKLHIGQPDTETPRLFFERIRDFREKTLAYGLSRGYDKLIEKIVEYYKNIDIHIDKNNVLITNGGSEALHFALLVACDPGDEIIVFEPFYPAYAAFAVSATAKLIPITTKAEEGFHLPAEKEIEQHISPSTKAILLSHPCNPTGVVYSRKEIEMLSNLAIKHDLLLIADEVYREFVYDDNEPYYSSGHIKKLEKNLVIIDSVSKRFSACGARIGCLISKNEDFVSLGLKYCQARGCPPTLEQIGAAALYETPISYINEVNKIYKERRDVLFEELKNIPGVICKKPEGAFYIMAGLPVDDAEKFIIWMLQEFSLDEETVMVCPAEGFYATPGLGKTEVRITYVLQKEDLKRAIYLLAKGLASYPGRTIS